MRKSDPDILRDTARLAVKHRLDGERFPAAVARWERSQGHDAPAVVLAVSLEIQWRFPGLTASGVASVLRAKAQEIEQRQGGLPVVAMNNSDDDEPGGPVGPMPTGPVPESDLDAVLRVASEPVRTMIVVQVHSGMRAAEVCGMTSAAVNRSGHVWKYRADAAGRVVFLGPEAQSALRPFLAVAGAMFRQGDGSPMTPRAYRQAVAACCKRAGVTVWTPHQLRATAAARLRSAIGAEAARQQLGHRRPEDRPGPTMN